MGLVGVFGERGCDGLDGILVGYSCDWLID